MYTLHTNYMPSYKASLLPSISFVTLDSSYMSKRIYNQLIQGQI